MVMKLQEMLEKRRFNYFVLFLHTHTHSILLTKKFDIKMKNYFVLLVINLWQVQEICSSLKIFRQVLETMKPPIQWAPGARCLEVKHLWSKVNHSSPPSAEINNAWSYTSTSHMSSQHKQGKLSICPLNCHLMFAKRPVTKTRHDFNPLIH